MLGRPGTTLGAPKLCDVTSAPLVNVKFRAWGWWGPPPMMPHLPWDACVLFEFLCVCVLNQLQKCTVTSNYPVTHVEDKYLIVDSDAY